MQGGRMERDRIVDTLNELIRAAEDSHLGFQRAAENAPDPDLKSLLNDIGARRGAIVRELQRLVATIGGAPEATGTLLGGAQRMLEDLQSVFRDRDGGTILDSLVRREDGTLERFQQALGADLPPEVAAGVMEQAARIRDDRDRLTARRASHAA